MGWGRGQVLFESETVKSRSCVRNFGLSMNLLDISLYNRFLSAVRVIIGLSSMAFSRSYGVRKATIAAMHKMSNPT